MPFTAWASTSTATQPYQFTPESFGALGNGKIGTGGTGTSGTNVFTDAGASFTSADVGKYIIINQGAGGVVTNPFCGTITGVNSATSVNLSANLGANASSAPYVYGTDDAPAIRAATLAAYNYAVANQYKAQVVFQPKLYMLGTLAQTLAQSWTGNPSGPYNYNTHVMLPFTGQYQRKLIIDFIGTGDSSDPDFWGSTVPSIQGTCLVSAIFTSSQPDGTYGQMSVLGAPATITNIGNGGITNGNFANVLVNINGMTIVTPYNSQQYSFDFRLAAQANVQNAAAVAFAPVNFSSQTVGGVWLNPTNVPLNTVAVGLAMPVSVNNDNCNVGLFVAEGLATGLLISEHFTGQRICTIYCGRGIQVTWQFSGTIIHGGSILYWSCEGCNYGVYTNAGLTAQYQLNIGNADFEAMVTAYVYDPSTNLTGQMNWYDLGGTLWSPSQLGMTGGNRYNILNCRMYPGPWVANASLNIPAPPSAPASATAQLNTAWRPAVVYASASTSITNTSVGPASGTQTALGQSAGANVAIPIRVPGGHWYSVTYTGTLTTNWVLE